MTPNPTLLLLSVDPSHPLAKHALRYAKAFCADSCANDSHDAKPRLTVFFYGDAARIASRLNWHSAEQTDITAAWQTLHREYDLELPVCVSTALSRGVIDGDNGKRHRLDGENIAAGFELVGLGVLAELMQQGVRVIQF